MNWYKKTLAQFDGTTEYFSELDLHPDVENIQDTLTNKYNAQVVKEIGRGDSGIAYELSNGDVLKITSNSQEFKVASFLMNNPNKFIINYKDVWQEGNLYYIIMEKLKTTVPEVPKLFEYFNRIVFFMEQNRCYNPECAIHIIRNTPLLKENPISHIVISYLEHIQNLPLKLFDIINPNNIGISQDNQLKFFDIN